MSDLNLSILQNQQVVFTATGMIFTPGMDYDTWAAIGETLQRMEMAVQFAIGDWINYGERAYGEKYSQAILETGRSSGTLRNYAWVAAHIHPSRRNDKVTFTHHVAVASLTPEYQTKFLVIAEQTQMSSRELKHAVDTVLGIAAEPHFISLTCPQCNYVWEIDRGILK